MDVFVIMGFKDQSGHCCDRSSQAPSHGRLYILNQMGTKVMTESK